MIARSKSISFTTLLATLRADLAARASDRRDRQALERDIAQFRTDAERAELSAILDRNRSEDSEQIRRLHSALVTTSAAASAAYR